jgi:hypothetical protein
MCRTHHVPSSPDHPLFAIDYSCTLLSVAHPPTSTTTSAQLPNHPHRQPMVARSVCRRIRMRALASPFLATDAPRRAKAALVGGSLLFELVNSHQHCCKYAVQNESTEKRKRPNAPVPLFQTPQCHEPPKP